MFNLEEKIKKYFKNISKDGVVANKSFRSLIKSFLINKGHIDREEIILKTDNEAITDSTVETEIFILDYVTYCRRDI